jgi:hypothetical protein
VPESRLVLERVRKRDVALPSLDILQPLVALVMVARSHAQKNTGDPRNSFPNHS